MTEKFREAVEVRGLLIQVESTLKNDICKLYYFNRIGGCTHLNDTVDKLLSALIADVVDFDYHSILHCLIITLSCELSSADQAGLSAITRSISHNYEIYQVLNKIRLQQMVK